MYLVMYHIQVNVHSAKTTIMQELVLEKETRVRELLLITGLRLWVHWTAWYIKQAVFLMFIALILTIFLKVRKIV